MKPNLTINLGVRYEIMTGWSEVKGNMTTFDPSVQNFNVFQFDGERDCPGRVGPGGMWYAFIGANGRTSLQAPKYDIVMPRVGFSWQILCQYRGSRRHWCLHLNLERRYIRRRPGERLWQQRQPQRYQHHQRHLSDRELSTLV